MNKLTLIGKYLDQPKLVNRFSKAVPALLIAGGVAYSANHVQKTPQQQRQKETIKIAAVMGVTILSALVAPRITSKMFGQIKPELNSDTARLVDDFLKNNAISKKSKEILIKAKSKILKLTEIKTIFEELGDNKRAKEFLNGEHGMIPDPENIDSKHIFGEIKRLSVLGLIPVLGGVTGGIIGDKLTEKDWKERIPNKVKEGSYQYLANIFLCNVGAGAALAIMEKNNVKSKASRAVGMIAGVLITGVIGGSAIANYIGAKLINPMFGHKHKKGAPMFSERKPEAVDVGLHVDDIATVAVMSGLKWIEPALPILYSISGYRAGIGYRNGHKQELRHHNRHNHDVNYVIFRNNAKPIRAYGKGSNLIQSSEVES